MPALPTHTGPFVAVATLCEKVLTDTDGAVSVIRIIDRLTLTASGPDPPEQMPPYALGLTALVMLRRGEARGRHQTRIVPQAPDGTERPAVEAPTQFSGDEEAANNIVIDLSAFAVDLEGLWWFDVLFGDEGTRIARIPLRVVYQPLRVAASGSTS
ncbi:MAG: hypothetical protein ABSC51_06965 [Gaiellaceae bacterium]|jgi:hypothetical protein